VKIKVNGTTLHYENFGNPNADQTILLIHGMGESGEIFAETIAVLVANGYRVVTIDSRGQGRSQPLAKGELLHYRQMAADTAAVINKLKLNKPLLVGYSDGGIIGAMVAAQHPNMLGGLVTCGANARPWGAKWGCWLGMAKDAALKRNPLHIMGATEPHIPVRELHQITCPTWILAGSRDLIREHETRRIAAAIPGAHLKILPGEDHGSYINHSEKLGKIILDLFPN